MDSMPSDLSVYLSNQTLKKIAGQNAFIESSMTGFKMKGGISGGTLGTAISTIEEMPREKIDLGRNLYLLSPGIFIFYLFGGSYLKDSTCQ
jgi:short subunit dehydrogenase-like uncharacterized protein